MIPKPLLLYLYKYYGHKVGQDVLYGSDSEFGAHGSKDLAWEGVR